MTADTRKDQNECRQYGHARFVALRPRLRRLSNGDPTLTKSTSRLARRGKPVRHEQWISHLHLVEPEIRPPLPGTYLVERYRRNRTCMWVTAPVLFSGRRTKFLRVHSTNHRPLDSQVISASSNIPWIEDFVCPNNSNISI